MTGRAPAVRDPGLQPERTRLAWRRTTLAGTVVGVLAVRQAVLDDVAGDRGTIALAGTALVWLAFLALAHRRTRLLGAGPIPATLSGGIALGAAGCTVALAALAMIMIV
ncbi:DUF202 domain-containing protein [Streptomyces yaizuensis]|uniref:DUF202 domain-containing protein n=1 Tax=Streptomyces yaizuensis TaxID=2989713 RepID=A0ABQ5P147_9ACTN|nr:DUF202 domain-containing protein [Streptomyces sp. YSPA8]GLF96200.1 DUF202 domain-containing protein [Streptomyces sp. YSPA8]